MSSISCSQQPSSPPLLFCPNQDPESYEGFQKELNQALASPLLPIGTQLPFIALAQGPQACNWQSLGLSQGLFISRLEFTS